MCYFLQPEKFMNCGRNLKYSGEELAVAISKLLGALSNSIIAVNATLAIPMGSLGITGFDVLKFLLIYWRYPGFLNCKETCVSSYHYFGNSVRILMFHFPNLGEKEGHNL